MKYYREYWKLNYNELISLLYKDGLNENQIEEVLRECRNFLNSKIRQMHNNNTQT